MKKIILTILTVLCMTAMVCCSNESVIMGNESTTTTTIATTINASTLALGKMIANAKLQESVMNGNTSWTEQTEISDYYPIYTAGIDGVSHIEFKLTTNGEDAGYILASVTDNDILVPECSDNAKSTTEIYRDALNRTDFNVYRYNWFESAAESADNGRGEVTVLASIGFDGGDITIHNGGRGEDSEFDNEYAQKKAAYAAKLQANKCLPYYDKTDLDKYYEQQTAAGRGEVEHTVYEYEKLDGYVGVCNKTKYILPSWNQPKLPNGQYQGQPIGCGPVAWAMVYAYWAEHKGKTNLFSVDISDNNLFTSSYYCNYDATFYNTVTKKYESPRIWDVMKEIHDLTGTTHSLVECDSYGLTWPADMPKGMQYAKNKGYSFNVDTKRNVMIYNNIYNEICADRPVIIYMDAWNFTSKRTTALHYAVAYGAGRKIYKSTNVVTEFWMDLNFGWGGKCRQVYCISEYYGDKPWADQDNAMANCLNYYQVNIK